MATFTVTTLTDENDGGAGGTGLSLREAVILANAAGGADEIEFAAGLSGTVRLTMGQIVISDALSIRGEGRITVSGDADGNDVVVNGATDLGATGTAELSDNTRIFDSTTDLALSGLTLTGGRSNAAGVGGAVRDTGGTLTLEDMVFAGNSTTANFANGGAVYYSGGGDLTVTDSEFFGNAVLAGGSWGGAIYSSGTTTLTNTTIAENQSVSRGAGIWASGGALAIVSSTITANTNVTDQGPGIYATATAPVTIADSIILGNVGDSTNAEIAALGGLTTAGMNIIGSLMADYDASADPNAVNADAADVFAATRLLTANTNTDTGGVVGFDGTDFFVALLLSELNPALDASAGSGIPAGDGRGELAQDQFSIGLTGPGARDLGAYEAGVFATALADTITGSRGADTIDGLAGNDTLMGGRGSDLLLGAKGDDRLIGFNGRDTLEGGAGADMIRGGKGDDRMSGGAQADVILGGIGDDTAFGDGGADRLFGGNGGDTLNGGNDDDTLAGEEGADRLNGEAGRDRLVGGADDDLLIGGSEADLFVFQDGFGADTITDFDALDTGEKIDLSAVTAITGLADLLADHAVQISTRVLIDDGAGNTIRLNGVSLGDLDGSDFIFV